MYLVASASELKRYLAGTDLGMAPHF